MFFPIADTPNPPGRPFATWALIGANVAVYLLVTLPASMGQVDLTDPTLLAYLKSHGVQGPVSAQQVLRHISNYDLLVFQYGFRPADFSWLTLFTSLFMHAGFLHLAGNMLFLYIFGDNVEYRLGRFWYLLTYLGCGVSATLFFALFAGGSQVPLIGASGAIFGVLGCYFLWFPKNKVRCFLFLFPFLMTNIYLSARLVLGFFLVIDNILPFILTSGSGSGIAHGAHIGGFLGGLSIAWGAERISVRPRRRNCPQSPVPEPPPQNLADALSHALETGRIAAAADYFLHLPGRTQRQQITSSAILEIGEYLLEQGRLQEALQVFRRFIAEHPNDPGLDRAYLGAGKTMLHNRKYLTSAYHYFLAAHDLAQSEEVANEAKRNLRRIEVGG